MQFKPTQKFDGKEAEICGVLTEEAEYRNGRYYYTITTQTLKLYDAPKLKKEMLIKISSKTPFSAQKYDQVAIQKVHLYTSASGLGQSSQAYYQSHKIALTGTFSSYNAEITGREEPWYAFADRLRNTMKDAIFWLLPSEQAGLACGILLGDRAHLSQTITEDFRTCGISHMLVVSGLHISILIAGLQNLLERLLKRKRLAAGLCLPILFLFMAVVGFTPSVLRSGMMMGMYLLATLCFRTADSFTSLALAAGLICFSNPCAAGDTGFQLSFLATLGILCLCERWTVSVKSLLPKKLQKNTSAPLLKMIVTTVSATLFTLPVSLISFGSVSVIAPIANVLLGIPAQWILQLSLITAVLQGCGLSFLARPIAWILGLLIRMMTQISAILAKAVPQFSFFSFEWLILIAVGLVLVALRLLFPKARSLPFCSFLFILMLFIGVSDFNRELSNRPAVTVIDCGEGIAVSVRSKQTQILILSDCGSYAAADCKNIFSQQAPDLLLLPGNYQRNCARVAQAALNGRAPKLTVLGAERIPDELNFLQESSVLFSSNSERIVMEDMVIEQIATQSGIWYRITVEETTVLIPTASCNAAELANDTKTADVLLLGHTVQNLSAISCKLVLLSASEELTYQYIRERVLPNTPSYSTDLNGTISCFLEENLQLAVLK